MADGIQIKGGAGDAEAAAVVAIVQHVLDVERIARSRRPQSSNLPPAWVRAGRARHPDDTLDLIAPDHRGDPL